MSSKTRVKVAENLISGPGQTVARKVAVWTHSSADRELEGVDGAPIRQRELRTAKVQGAVRQHGIPRMECLLVLHREEEHQIEQ